MKTTPSTKFTEGTVTITDWGRFHNGEHFNARLTYTHPETGKYCSDDIDHELTRREAKLLNRKDRDGMTAGLFHWKAGDRSIRFFSEEDAIAAAAARAESLGFLDLVTDQDVQPGRVLYCRDPSLGPQLRWIGAVFHHLWANHGLRDVWEAYPEATELLESAWRDLLETLRSRGQTHSKSRRRTAGH